MAIDEKLLVLESAEIKSSFGNNLRVNKIEHPILRRVVDQRMYMKNNFEVNYHDDTVCGYTCHSDHGDDS